MITCGCCGNEGAIDGLGFEFDYEVVGDGNVLGVVTCIECGKSLAFDVFNYIDFDSLAFHTNADDWE